MRNLLTNRWARFVIIQLITYLCLLVLLAAHLPSLLALGLALVVAYFLASRYYAEPWWRWIHLLFLPLIFIAQLLELPAYMYLLALAVSWFLFGMAARTRVPVFLSEQAVLQTLAQELALNSRFLDIGAGNGRVLAFLAKERPDLQLFGTEIAWPLWLFGKLTLPSRVKWWRRDYRQLDLSDYDYVYAYLSPAVMDDVWQQAQEQMQPGSCLLSNSFSTAYAEPSRTIPLNDWKDGSLLIWQL
ncbi:class I SAM-dependent methyltransferase [Chitinibacter sp. ZOR0017]|uniref:class I SAM-dependent methyltransferase n=1 Tax=Chitinibacter sp. ZOR0017 TaxID=1339254 RepID=UPI00068E94BC|nr:class I SAM-dependent methyltransferase [Chitinibacter sp. ZOR0017]